VQKTKYTFPILFSYPRKKKRGRREASRIKTQTVLPSAETAAMLFWTLLASGQISDQRAQG
jgi:hypothetical protein